jgi:tRNA(fMet)-specific endonuclease VapC
VRFEGRILNGTVVCDDAVITRASDLYAELRRAGRAISDADLFIAATASEQGLTLITNNLADYQQTPGLELGS